MIPHVTVVAKAPVAGRVKTRLCPPCTPTEAAELAEDALRDTIDAVDDLVVGIRVRRVLLLDGAVPDWVPPWYDVVPQSVGGLGDRLAAGFAELGAGVIVGMETPHAVGGLGVALDAIANGEDALGPAHDGGYWAIALTRPDAHVFSGIEMSTPHTGRDQLARLHELGRCVSILEPARDIDDFDDVRALAASDGWGRAVVRARALVDTVTARDLEG